MGQLSSRVTVRDGDGNVSLSRTRDRPVRVQGLEFVDGECSTFYIWHDHTPVVGPCVSQNIFTGKTTQALYIMGHDYPIKSPLDYNGYKITYAATMLVGCGPAGTHLEIGVVKYL